MKLDLINSSRSRILAGMIIFAVGLFVARLFFLQIIQHEHYVQAAASEQVKRLTIPAKRGLIYTLNNGSPAPLVMNETVYTVFADPFAVPSGEENKVVQTLQTIAGGNTVGNFKELLGKKDSRYQVLAKDVSNTQANKIKAARLTGIGLQQGTKRVYPEGSLASQILGFVNSNGQGQYGIEGGLDKELRGTDGLLQSVTDVSDVPLTIGDNNIDKPAKDGTSPVLTIDRSVQSYVEQILPQDLKKVGATNGSVIVMDPNNGHIVAMANAPTYDVSHYGDATDASAYQNDVISLPFEPASVMKTFTMATGINQGTITPDSTYTNTDHITIDGSTISNAALGHTGVLSMQQVLNWSLNTGTVTVAQRLGDGSINAKARQTIYQYFHDRFGFGQNTGIELAGESPGIVVSPNNADGEGNAVRYANMTFGQGLDVTMLQVATGFSAVINGGTYYKPTIIAGSVDSNGNYVAQKDAAPRTNVISATTSADLRTMLQKARASAPFLTVSDRKGYTIGGKTGTAQTIENGRYVMNQTVGTYLGFGASNGNKPQYVIMVRVAAPGKNLEGGEHANPIFNDVSGYMIDHLKMKPGGN